MTHSSIDVSNHNEETDKPATTELPASERPASALPPLPEPDKRIDPNKMPNLPALPVVATTEKQAELPPLPKPGDDPGGLPSLPRGLDQNVELQLPSGAETPDNGEKPALPVLPVTATTEEQSVLPQLPKPGAASGGLPSLPGALDQDVKPQLPSGTEATDDGEKAALPTLPSFEVKSSDKEGNTEESEDSVSEKSEPGISDVELSQAERPLLEQSNPSRMPAIPVLPKLPVLGELPNQSNSPASTKDTTDTVEMKSGEVEKPDKTEISENANEDVAVEQAPDAREEKKATVRIVQTLKESEPNLPEDGQSTSTDSETDSLASVQETELDIPEAIDMKADPSNGDPQPESQGKIQVELPQQSKATRRELVVDQGFLAYMESLDDGDRVKLLALPQIIAHWVASVDGQVDIHESLIIHRILKDGAIQIDEEFQNLRWENQAEVNKWIESVMPKDLPMLLRAQFNVLLMPLDEYRSIFETMPTELRKKFGNFACDTCTEVAEASDEGNGIAGKIGLEEKFVIQLIRESLGIDAPKPRANEN